MSTVIRVVFCLVVIRNNPSRRRLQRGDPGVVHYLPIEMGVRSTQSFAIPTPKVRNKLLEENDMSYPRVRWLSFPLCLHTVLPAQLRVTMDKNLLN